MRDAAFCAGADDFDAFVVFVESIVGKGFIALLDSVMQKVIIDILHRAGDSGEWASGYALPEAVLQRATTALVNLSDIQSKTNAADFLAGVLHGFSMTTVLTYMLVCAQLMTSKCVCPPCNAGTGCKNGRPL